MPPLSLLFGKVDFSGLFISLNGEHYATLKAAQDAHAPILAYGAFLNTVVNFLIVVLRSSLLSNRSTVCARRLLRLQIRVCAPTAKLLLLMTLPVAPTALHSCKNKITFNLKGVLIAERLF